MLSTRIERRQILDRYKLDKQTRKSHNTNPKRKHSHTGPTKLLRHHRPRPITYRIRMFWQQMPKPTHSHLLIATAYMFIQKIEADLGVPGSKRVRFQRIAGSQLILLYFLLAQQPVPVPIRDRVRMVRHEMTEPTDVSALHSVTSDHHPCMPLLPALVHVLEAQIAAGDRVRVVLAGRQRGVAAVRGAFARHRGFGTPRIPRIGERRPRRRGRRGHRG